MLDTDSQARNNSGCVPANCPMSSPNSVFAPGKPGSRKAPCIVFVITFVHAQAESGGRVFEHADRLANLVVLYCWSGAKTIWDIGHIMSCPICGLTCARLPFHERTMDCVRSNKRHGSWQGQHPATGQMRAGLTGWEHWHRPSKAGCRNHHLVRPYRAFGLQETIACWRRSAIDFIGKGTGA